MIETAERLPGIEIDRQVWGVVASRRRTRAHAEADLANISSM
jgi:hypothetical protein